MEHTAAGVAPRARSTVQHRSGDLADLADLLDLADGGPRIPPASSDRQVSAPADQRPALWAGDGGASVSRETRVGTSRERLIAAPSDG